MIPGIWFYTEKDHPESHADTFNWEEEDVLLWQIGDEQYQGYDANTAQLENMEDDVIKIVVELEEDDPDDIALNNVSKNIERVAMRVRNGGHHIPTEDILRRDETSFKHLYECAPIIDNIVLIDNSKDGGEIILEINDRKPTFRVNQLPHWVLPLYQQFQKKPPTEL
ncbi:hypothetical protein [Lentibacillus sp. CBA3610]|uniref:hypothetical protein n=1 Tax=Lentibacillus sp. CBA3610 TaxID=2518176 RepID=UPI0015952BCB|nr:hypothetical protein [Lentibacillus sp. CBA3610]